MLSAQSKSLLPSAAIMVIVGILAGVTARAQVSEQESLKGLEGVLVVIEDLHADATRVELTRQSIIDEVEARLKDSGIRILSIRERLADERRPYLYVNCNIVLVPDIELVTFSIDVESHQIVTLKNGEDAVALTWAKSYLGVQSKEKAAGKILEVVRDLVDQFISDYRAANR